MFASEVLSCGDCNKFKVGCFNEFTLGIVRNDDRLAKLLGHLQNFLITNPLKPLIH